MASIHDVAKYVLDKQGSMSAMKLQKLTYYCQAWSLVWEEEALFPEHFEAWANGPVSPSLYNIHRGMFKVDRELFDMGNVCQLNKTQKETIDLVLEAYGKLTAQALSDLSHQEPPWSEAREGLSPMTRCNNEISHAAMHEYFSAL